MVDYQVKNYLDEKKPIEPNKLRKFITENEGCLRGNIEDKELSKTLGDLRERIVKASTLTQEDQRDLIERIDNLSDQKLQISFLKLQDKIQLAYNKLVKVSEMVSWNFATHFQKILAVYDYNQLADEIMNDPLFHLFNNANIKPQRVDVKKHFNQFLDELGGFVKRKSDLIDHLKSIEEKIIDNGFQDESIVFETLKLAAKTEAESIAKDFSTFNIKDENKRFEIAKTIAEIDGRFICNNIKNFGIKDEKKRFELLLLVTNKFSLQAMESFDNFEIKDETLVYEYAKVCAKAMFGFGEFFKKFTLNDYEKKVLLVKTHAAVNGHSASQHIKNFELKEEDRIEVAKICASQNGSATSLFIERFDIDDEEVLFEIAKIAARQNGTGTSRNFANYHIKDPLKHREIARLCYEASTLIYLRAFKLPESVYQSYKQAVFSFILRNDRELKSDVFEEILLYDSKAVENINWIVREINKVIIPNEYSDEIDILAFNKKLEELYAQLKDKAGVSFESYYLANKSSTLPIQMSNFTLLCRLVALSQEYSVPLTILDQEGVQSTLKNILNMSDPVLKLNAIESLVKIYRKENEDKLGKWLEARNKIPPYLHLPALGLALIEGDYFKYLENLSPNYYQDSEVLKPINEIIFLLNREMRLTDLDKQALLNRLIIPPEPADNKAKTKQTVLEKHRLDQKNFGVSVRDVLLFERGDRLKKGADVVAIWKQTCREVFGVNDDHLAQFTETFQNSPRYPGALFSYAARLHTLPLAERESLIKTLGTFVSSVLDKSFPKIRYNLENNPHLQNIFKDKPDLLKKWVDNLSIKASDLHSTSNQVKENPIELLKREFKNSLDDKHLGSDQEKKYSFLTKTNLNNEVEIKKAIAELEPLAIDKDRKFELACLKLFLLPENEIKAKLNELLPLVPVPLFKSDISGIIRLLSPQKLSIEELTVEESVNWIDLLLLGTEVINSCQSIIGDADFNKALLGYLLDGKIKPMIVRNKEGRIVARAVMRVLKDEKGNDVLFLERSYFRVNNPILRELLQKGATEKAARMGIPIVVSERDYPNSVKNKAYPYPLNSSFSASPEYVDALGGIKTGFYTIKESRFLNAA
jgi:hypothetical protein